MKKEKHVLVAGGAGYIGSHTVRSLHQAGIPAVVLDNLVYGHRDSLPKKTPFIKGDLGDQKLVSKIIRKYNVDAVMHFAAFAYVGESVTDPAKYYQNNTVKPMALLEAMRENNCRYFIFSSTCATYGDPQFTPITEAHPQNPINPYGRTKLFLELILRDYEKAYGIRSVKLRYFNAAGAAEDGSIGEDHRPETHLIPLLLKAAKGSIAQINVYGTDYPTADGTCIRDYIHINDLADAHIRALKHLRNGGSSDEMNLGTGKGHSVLEVIRAAEEVSGRKIQVNLGARREGDPAVLVADACKAERVLGWKAQKNDLKDILASAWKWENGPFDGKFQR